MKIIFYRFFENLLGIFRGKNFFWHLLAIVLTYVLVVSGFDWKYFVFWNGSALQNFLFSAAILGGLLPILLPLSLYLVGKYGRRAELVSTAAMTLQAAILGSLVSSFYKIFTGRLQPPHPGSLNLIISSINKTINGVSFSMPISSNLIDISRDFQFGFFRHGIFWGWPSSHTTIAFAIGTALFVLYPKNLLVRIFSVLFMFYIGIGVSMSIHWFSDFVAGAIIGSVIGLVVGKAFLNRSGLFIAEGEKRV